MQENESVNTEKNKKGKIKFLLVGAFLIIGIAIGLFVGYKRLNNDPIIIYKDTINNGYDLLNKSLKEAEDSLGDFDPLKEPFVLKLNAKLDSDINELKKFSGLNYNIELGLDYNNKKMNIEGEISEENQKIISALVAVLNKNIYLNSPEILDKTIDLGEQDIWSDMEFKNDINFSYDDYDYILKELKNILIDSLAKDKFEIKDETIKINDKEYKAKKVLYNLDKDNLKRTIDYIKEQILKDDKLLNSLANVSDNTVAEIKDSLNEETNLDDYQDMDIVLYTDKLNKLIAGSLILENAEIIKFDCLKDEVNIKIESDDTNINIQKDNKDNYTINMEDTDYQFNLTIKNIKTSKNLVSADITFNLNSSEANISLDGSYSLEKKSLKDFDTKNSVKAAELSEEEMMEMFTKLSEVLERFDLDKLFNIG